ncbi:hypothetical protein ACWDTT_15865 [Streptosporangium sandarakinum]
MATTKTPAKTPTVAIARALRAQGLRQGVDFTVAGDYRTATIDGKRYNERVATTVSLLTDRAHFAVRYQGAEICAAAHADGGYVFYVAEMGTPGLRTWLIITNHGGLRHREITPEDAAPAADVEDDAPAARAPQGLPFKPGADPEHVARVVAAREDKAAADAARDAAAAAYDAAHPVTADAVEVDDAPANALGERPGDVIRTLYGYSTPHSMSGAMWGPYADADYCAKIVDHFEQEGAHATLYRITHVATDFAATGRHWDTVTEVIREVNAPAPAPARVDWTQEPASADNPLTPVALKAGDRAVYDSFAGTVPCKVTRIYVREDLTLGSRVVVDIRVTVTTGAYRAGEILTGLCWDRIVPRASVVRRGSQYVIRNNWHPVITR